MAAALLASLLSSVLLLWLGAVYGLCSMLAYGYGHEADYRALSKMSTRCSVAGSVLFAMTLIALFLANVFRAGV